MAYGTIYNAKVSSYEITDFVGVAFADKEKFIPESQPISINSTDASFFSEAILWSFNTTGLQEHFETNPINAYLEIVVDYLVTNPAGIYKVVFNGQFCFDKKNISNVHVYAENDTTTQINDNETRQAKFRIYADTLPTAEVLASEKFAFLLSLYCANPDEQNIDIFVNDIQINIYSSSGGSYMAIYDSSNKVYVEENGTIKLPKIYPNSTAKGNFRIYNFGSQKLIIGENGITSETVNARLEPKVDKQDITIEYLKYLEVPYEYSGSNINTTYDATLFILSTANNRISDFWAFVLNFSTTELATGKLEIYYENQKLISNDAISLLTLPQGINNTINVVIKNVGEANLIINNIQFAGLFSSKTADSLTNITLVPNEQKIIEINIQDQVLGSGAGSVSVISSDFSQSLFKFDGFVEIVETFKLTVKNGVEANFAETQISNGETVSLGILSRNRSYRKYYNLTNSGIYNNIQIDSIQMTSEDAYLSDLPILPVILNKNGANFISFAIVFDTAQGAIKESDLVINYTKIE